MTILDRDLWDRMQRAAQYAAARGFGRASAPWLSRLDRYETALDAITAHVAANGAPAGDDIKPWLQATSRALSRLERDAPVHLRHAAYWSGRRARDELAEQVTDEVGVTQLLGALTVMQRAVVRALADAYLAGGGPAQAAAALGMTPRNYSACLYAARRRAASLWVAPGDTAPRRYTAQRNRRPTKAEQWRRNSAKWARRALRDEPA